MSKSKFHFSPIYSRCRIGPRKSLTNYSNGSILSADAVDAAQSLSANIGIRNRHQRMADGTMNCLFFYRFQHALRFWDTSQVLRAHARRDTKVAKMHGTHKEGKKNKNKISGNFFASNVRNFVLQSRRATGGKQGDPLLVTLYSNNSGEKTSTKRGEFRRFSLPLRVLLEH